MRTPEEIRRDLPPDLDPLERERLVALALRLEARTPPPAPTFRGDLRRHLLGTPDPRASGPAPRTTHVLAASYVAAGALLLAIATLGLAGAGPLAPA